MRIQDQLLDIGVRPGDLLMLHASMRRIGPVTGGAQGLIALIEEVIGDAGTLMMIAGAENGWDWIHKHPVEERAALVAAAPPFDAWTTPAYHEVGVLAEQFRQMPGTLVTNHPEGRFIARGAKAEALLADAPWDDYYGPGSPLQKLCEWDGRILRMGADPETVTALHYAEYLCSLPEKRRVTRHVNMGTPGQPDVRTVSCLDDEEGIVDWAGEDYFALITKAYLESGKGERGLIGLANAELLNAADLVAFGTDWMTRHLGHSATN